MPRQDLAPDYQAMFPETLYRDDRERLYVLREHLRDAAVIAGWLSEAVSDRRIPAELASEVAATRNVIIGAQSCAAVLARQLEERAKTEK